ncbi:MAG TPA: hypothetical protein VGM05_25970 [Planctomycetaceae bacterium]|jgi:hypothetical protein
MSRVVEVVFARSGCAFILGSVGGLIGLVSWGAWTAQSDYPRSPSSIVWAFVGGTFGFVLGACMGSRRLTGRRGWLVSGLVAGMLLGALIGSIQAHAEYGFAREQLLQAGLPVMFIDAAEGGLSVRGFETIGLQYGICLGILAGATAGWFWNHPPRFSPVANLFPVLASCFVALSMIAMHSGFRDLSTDVIGRVGRSWRACKSPKVSDDSRPGPELNPESQAHSVRRRFHSIPSSAWNRTSRSSASRRTKGQCRSPLARRRAGGVPICSSQFGKQSFLTCVPQRSSHPYT